ncbi:MULTISPECIES: ATP synthase F1 subunit epsilon [Prevotella]|uniref:F0F1 ATP synthase subunit epsilon n=1 Tax=Prevotella herbatica TaxID=2801997 RepID=A0ABN6EK83_9BACT|nr:MULTISPECIES: ATP synthase F1 subunit epsilon [Prevotella]MDN5553025.1 ATP synthase F1 subunit epsilon [Prevotella sp.]BCS86297.1 F0F1 ATP synthase subunit epsilon [Prevotella herbatica]
MTDMSLKLKIVSPEKVEFNGEADIVKVPGLMGMFEILSNHAPIISALQEGIVEFVTNEGRKEVAITGGFVEVQKNDVNICVEKAQ